MPRESHPGSIQATDLKYKDFKKQLNNKSGVYIYVHMQLKGNWHGDQHTDWQTDKPTV